jgi:hypothetical protein
MTIQNIQNQDQKPKIWPKVEDIIIHIVALPYFNTNIEEF